MLDAYAAHRRFASVLAIKGAAMITLGATALLWSDAALVDAMMLASLLLALLGLHEMVLGIRARHASRGWPIPLADGFSTIGLALLGGTLTAIPHAVTMLLASVWLGANGLLFGGIALAVWPMAATRRVLLLWCAINLVLAGTAVASPSTLVLVLYVGAAYAVVYGFVQLAAGAWVWYSAAPEVEPTRQARWIAARDERPADLSR